MDEGKLYQRMKWRQIYKCFGRQCTRNMKIKSQKCEKRIQDKPTLRPITLGGILSWQTQTT